MSDEIELATEPVGQVGDAEARTISFLTPKRSAVLAIVGVIALLSIGAWAALIMIFAILLSVMLHECGHFFVARKSGMKCTEFFVGFGPRIWSMHRNGVEYGVKAIPLGGYVKIIGMHNLEEVEEGDEKVAYRAQSFPRRLATIFAGPLTNILIALVATFFLLVTVGEPHTRTTLGGDGSYLVAADVVSKLGIVCDEAKEITSAKLCKVEMPAQQAGLRAGDTLLAIDGKTIPEYEQISSLVNSSAKEFVTVTYLRDGVKADAQVRPIPLALTDIGELDYSKRFLGVMPSFYNERVDVVSAVPKTFTFIGKGAWLSAKALVNFVSPSSLSNLFRQASSKPGAVSIQDPAVQKRPISVLGVVLLADRFNSVVGLLTLLIGLNLFLAIVNLLPLLPFDGGHIAVAVYERIRTRRGREYRVDMAKLMPLMYATLLFFVVIGLTTIYLDAAHPIR